MVTLPLLTEQDLEIFKGKKVVIYGLGEASKLLRDIFISLEIEVVAFWLESGKGLLKKNFLGLPIITSAQLEKLSRQTDKLIVQGTSFDTEKNNRLDLILSSFHVEFSTISVGQLGMTFGPAIILNRLEKDLGARLEQYGKARKKKNDFSWFCFNRKQVKNKIFICLPPKTGDFTLKETFTALNEAHASKRNARMRLFLNAKIESLSKKHAKLALPFRAMRKLFGEMDNAINFFNLVHNPKCFDAMEYQTKHENIKIITAMREPISQNLSVMYQQFTSSNFLEEWMLGVLQNKTEEEKTELFKELKEVFVTNGADVQLRFDAFIPRYIYANDAIAENASIQQFMQHFKEYILDITAYPFDQEKGYAIIKKDNVEVFVYQLEKLNYLIPKLSAFVGVPFDKLVNGNQASDKWIAESYKQAQKEIKITQEYFDKCFDEPYVKHCYSEADIEKFKARWRTHIEN